MQRGREQHGPGAGLSRGHITDYHMAMDTGIDRTGLDQAGYLDATPRKGTQAKRHAGQGVVGGRRVRKR